MELDTAIYGGVAVILLLMAALVLLAGHHRDRDLEERLRAASGGPPPKVARIGGGHGAVLAGLRRVGDVLRSQALFSERDLADLERTVAAGGFSPRRAVSIFIGLKALLFVLLPAGGYALALLLGGGHELQAVVVGGVAGLMGPNWVLGWRRKSRIAALTRGLPDAMDMMVVCAEAGLGLDAVVERVARELSRSSPPMAAQFTLLAHELKVLPDRRMALARMSERGQIDGLKQLASTMAQTFRFGTPLSQALRILSADLRHQRMLRLEAKAARLPALMVGPLILFIMPCLFIVLVGPSVITLMENL